MTGAAWNTAILTAGIFAGVFNLFYSCTNHFIEFDAGEEAVRKEPLDRSRWISAED